MRALAAGALAVGEGLATVQSSPELDGADCGIAGCCIDRFDGGHTT